MTERFEVHADYAPAGDQPAAIARLVQGLDDGLARQILLGVTGSGKTFTIAHVIAQLQRPALILAPNKTLAAQLYGEMKGFFPRNAVEYFVSYYDYYQPEAYVASTDTYIEKDASINEHIEQMRLSATKAMLERRDAIVVAVWVTPRPISAWCCTCCRGIASTSAPCCAASPNCSTPATSWSSRAGPIGCAAM